MGSDKRKKGCPNESCERHQKRIMLNATEEYCPKCGTKLIYVCSKCFREIEDIDPNHKTCSLCDVVAPVAVGVVGKVIKDGQKGAIKQGVRIVENAIKNMIIKR